MVEGDWLNVVDRPISWRTNQAEVQNGPRLRKIVGKVAKCPAGRRLLAGQRRGAYWWRTEGFGMGFAAVALKALQLDELAGLGGLAHDCFADGEAAGVERLAVQVAPDAELKLARL